MDIAIVGTGYVGLVSGTCFAEMGVNVTCVDVDTSKIEKLKQGIIPIYEPGLEDMVHKNVEAGRLHFVTDLASVLDEVDVVFSAVGTPPDEDGSADLKYVLEVARTIGRNMNKYLVVVTKSTVPVGTAQKVKTTIRAELDKRGVNIDFDVASNPEFLKEGAAIKDFMSPDRVVVGVESNRSREIMARLYKPFMLSSDRIIFTDIPSAEMIKYAANSMLATRISFMNDIANLCEIVGADVNMVRKGIGSDTRIGKKFLYPGCGYGGSCFPKDVKALIKTASDNNCDSTLLEAADIVNKKQRLLFVDKILNFYNGNIEGKTFAVWGLAFKPKTNDMREAPSITIINKLLSLGAKIKSYDPKAFDLAKTIFKEKIEYSKDAYSALNGSDALLVLTEWNEFKRPDYDKIASFLNEPVIFDGRNIYDSNKLIKKGFKYFCIGKNTTI